MSDTYEEIQELIENVQSIVVIQAENPDGDSLSSTLALEEILSDLGKEVSMYCPVQIPKHLKHLKGWDRVSNELSKNFDLSIIVDTSAMSLLEKVFTTDNARRINSKPLLVIDHHDVESDIESDQLHNLMNSSAVATGEVIYELCKAVSWPINLNASSMLASSIMYDSLGLTTGGTTSRSIHIIAELVEKGVSLTELEAARRKLMKKSQNLTAYKGQLLQRIEVVAEGACALLHIPWEEIEKYSDQYNPSMLVIDDMRLIEGVKIAVALKTYPDGRITGKIRANHGYAKANELASGFGGGGHPYAAGFKTRKTDLNSVKHQIIETISEWEHET